MQWNLHFHKSDVSLWADRYIQNNKDQKRENEIERQISPKVREHGFYTKEEFLAVCEWKSRRPEKFYAKNDEDFIQEITRIALSSRHERLRIEILRVLEGVDWPTASALLHFGSKDRYPILDFRALSSLSISPPPPYTFDFWMEYVETCRHLADELKVDMRTLDRALWQFSKKSDKGKHSDDESKRC